jgi:outer membrane protein W
MVRTFFVALFASLLLASAVFAQQKREFSVFLSDVAGTSDSHERAYWAGGAGAAYSMKFTPRLSVQLAAAAEEHRTYPYFVIRGGGIFFVPQARIRTYPIDLTARYHWANDTRWQPFLGAGLRYVAAPHVDPNFQYRTHLNAEVIGGLEFLVRPTLGITVDARQLLGDRENYDPLLKVSAGVSFHF